MVMFGLAKEYEKIGDYAKVIAMLENYLTMPTMRAMPTVSSQTPTPSGRRDKAMEAYRRGIRRINGTRPSIDGE